MGPAGARPRRLSSPTSSFSRRDTSQGRLEEEKPSPHTAFTFFFTFLFFSQCPNEVCVKPGKPSTSSPQPCKPQGPDPPLPASISVPRRRHSPGDCGGTWWGPAWSERDVLLLFFFFLLTISNPSPCCFGPGQVTLQSFSGRAFRKIQPAVGGRAVAQGRPRAVAVPPLSVPPQQFM